MDGHPRFVIPQGQSYLYEFEVKNRAGTYWYHPHPHGRTGPQVYGGLAGLFIVSDEEEKAAGLPSGEYDIPLVIQDRAFDSDNQLVYMTGHMMERMNGFLGDWILVNGHPNFILPIATRAYRPRPIRPPLIIPVSKGRLTSVVSEPTGYVLKLAQSSSRSPGPNIT